MFIFTFLNAYKTMKKFKKEKGKRKTRRYAYETCQWKYRVSDGNDRILMVRTFQHVYYAVYTRNRHGALMDQIGFTDMDSKQNDGSRWVVIMKID